jgi:hypothetical protein
LATDESTPFTSVVSVFPVEVATFEVTIELVPTEPPTFEVKVFPVAPKVLVTCRFAIEVVARFVVPVAVRLPVAILFAVRLLADVVANCAVPVAVMFPVKSDPTFAILAKRLVKIPVTDESQLATSELAVVVAFSLRLVSSLIDVVVAIPLTVEVRVLVEVANESWLVVVGADGRVVVLITPFTFEVRMLPATETALFEMTLDVAEIPLIVVVKVLPASDCEKLFTILATLDVTPFMMVESRLPVEVATLLFTILDVALTPLVLFVKTLPALERVLDEMTDVVAVTPLIVVVKVLPATD